MRMREFLSFLRQYFGDTDYPVYFRVGEGDEAKFVPVTYYGQFTIDGEKCVVLHKYEAPTK